MGEREMEGARGEGGKEKRERCRGREIELSTTAASGTILFLHQFKHIGTILQGRTPSYRGTGIDVKGLCIAGKVLRRVAGEERKNNRKWILRRERYAERYAEH